MALLYDNLSYFYSRRLRIFHSRVMVVPVVYRLSPPLFNIKMENVMLALYIVIYQNALLYSTVPELFRVSRLSSIKSS